MIATTDRNSEIGLIIRGYRGKYQLADEIARKFMLASALEPLADKPGCTTRQSDLKPSKRLEYFIAAGINSGFALKRMIEACQPNGMRGAYAFFPELVALSRFNRGGGKINQGILEAIIPIVCAQIIDYDAIQHDPRQVLRSARDYLRFRTTDEDVENLIKGKELANEISGVGNKYPVNRHNAGTVFDYYAKECEFEQARGDQTGVLHNRQFIDCFSDISYMLDIMMLRPDLGLLDKTVRAYNSVLDKHEGKMGAGLAADHCAVALYVYIALIDHREPII